MRCTRAGRAPRALADASTLSEGDDEPERPPSPSLEKRSAEDDGEQVLYEGKCKVFFKKARPQPTAPHRTHGSQVADTCTGLQDNGWSERGLGSLQLRRQKDGAHGARLLVRNDTGKLMLNANLYPGLKVMLKDKNLIMSLVNFVEQSSQPGKEGEAPSEPANQLVLTCAWALRVRYS